METLFIQELQPSLSSEEGAVGFNISEALMQVVIISNFVTLDRMHSLFLV